MKDTMVYAFTYPVFNLIGGSKVFSYTHYPTISTDMLNRVVERRSLYNNNEKVSSSVTLSKMKIYYYKLFAKMYGFFGSFASIVFVNSSWTYNHITHIWGCKDKIFTLFPPCDTTLTQDFPFDPRDDMIVSVSQFRPEKDQKLQIKAYSLYKKKWSESNSKNSQLAKFYLIGSCRNESDQNIIDDCKKLCVELGVSDDVHFVVNAEFKKLLEFLSKSKIGLHSMWNEVIFFLFSFFKIKKKKSILVLALLNYFLLVLLLSPIIVVVPKRILSQITKVKKQVTWLQLQRSIPISFSRLWKILILI